MPLVGEYTGVYGGQCDVPAPCYIAGEDMGTEGCVFGDYDWVWGDYFSESAALLLQSLTKAEETRRMEGRVSSDEC